MSSAVYMKTELYFELNERYTWLLLLVFFMHMLLLCHMVNVLVSSLPDEELV